MSILSVNFIAARIADGVARLIQSQERARSHSAIVCHLESMPDYLRQDIGLLNDADILEAVEHGRLRDAPDRDTYRDLTLIPHAA